MSLGINSNIGGLNSANNASKAQSMLNKALERLSSGRSINKGSDKDQDDDVKNNKPAGADKPARAEKPARKPADKPVGKSNARKPRTNKSKSKKG